MSNVLSTTLYEIWTTFYASDLFLVLKGAVGYWAITKLWGFGGGADATRHFEHLTVYGLIPEDDWIRIVELRLRYLKVHGDNVLASAARCSEGLRPLPDLQMPDEKTFSKAVAYLWEVGLVEYQSGSHPKVRRKVQTT